MNPRPNEVWAYNGMLYEVTLLILEVGCNDDPTFPYRCLTLSSTNEEASSPGDVDDWRLAERDRLARIT